MTATVKLLAACRNIRGDATFGYSEAIEVESRQWPAVEQLIREAPARGEREAGRFRLAVNHRSYPGGTAARAARHRVVGGFRRIRRTVGELAVGPHACIEATASASAGAPRRASRRDLARQSRAFTFDWMPPEVNPPRGAGRAIRAHGRRLPVRVLPSLPAASAVPSPYETGDFRGSDIFCPLRATEVRAARDLETGATN